MYINSKSSPPHVGLQYWMIENTHHNYFNHFEEKRIQEIKHGKQREKIYHDFVVPCRSFSESLSVSDMLSVSSKVIMLILSNGYHLKAKNV